MRLSARLCRAALWATLTLTLPGCASRLSPTPDTVDGTATSRLLRALPAPKEPLVVAVYGYQDLTGKFEASETLATYSHAVTQGAASVVGKALADAGSGRWFTLVEREHLADLITERKIISEQRQNYRTAEGNQLPPLPPMLYAGLLLEGGIIGYDSNTTTGGLGANYLGIGGNVQYQEDIVTVYLRAVSTQTGQILAAVRVKKKIISYGLDANVFKFVAFQKLLQGEAGYTSNEPGMIALEQAIEKAVAALIVQGVGKGLWSFADPAAGQAFLDKWNDSEDDETSPAPPQAPSASRGVDQGSDRGAPR